MIPVVVVVFIVVVTVTFTACGILDGTVTLDDCGVTSTLGETRLPSILKKKIILYLLLFYWKTLKYLKSILKQMQQDPK